jgi:hypothetical protein
MSKEYVQTSLERDAFLFRHSDKQAALQNLYTTVERLAKLMPLSNPDKAELLAYAERLMESQTSNTHLKTQKQVPPDR